MDSVIDSRIGKFSTGKTKKLSKIASKGGEVQEEAMKRFNLVLPEGLFIEIQEVAKRRHTTVLELLRRFILLGLLAIKADEDSECALIFREGDKEKEIILI